MILYNIIINSNVTDKRPNKKKTQNIYEDNNIILHILLRSARTMSHRRCVLILYYALITTILYLYTSYHILNTVTNIVLFRDLRDT